MDPFYSLLIFVVLLALEVAAGQSWVGVYYRLGIPVYRARRGLKTAADPGDGGAKDLARMLEGRLKDQPGFPALRFKALESEANSRPAVAFHEALFSSRGGPRYFPVMHSLVQADRQKGEAWVTGWINWYVVFLLIYLAVRTIADRGFLIVAVVVLVLFGLSYAAQAAVNQKVVDAIQENT